jgi:hypothetical protein
MLSVPLCGARQVRAVSWLVGLLHIAALLQACAVTVPNASFEEVKRGTPANWIFIGPDATRAGAWTAEEPLSGKHALRLDAQFGSQSWESDAIPARGGQKYLVRWQTRFRGEKAWRFRADFCGVEVLFKNKEGHALDSARQHSYCWQTRGWQPGWFLFTSPSATETLHLRFAIATATPLPGGFDVDNVELDEWPPIPSVGKSNVCRLTLKVQDELGQLVPARIRITDRNGRAVRPPGAISYEQDGGSFHPLEEGICHALVERGLYSITVTRGFEYEPWKRDVEAKRDHQEMTIRLRRLWDWRQRGWFNGDHHTHLHRHGGSLFPTLQWPDVLRVARSEGLDFLPFMGADRYPSDPGQISAGFRKPDFVYELTEEITEDFWGHVCPIGVAPRTRKDQRYREGPMHVDRHAAMAGSGGILCFGHPHGPLGDKEDLEAISKFGMGHVARELPVDLALGIPCAIDLLTMEGPYNQLERKLRDLYRLWNLGFRPVVAASTDFHVDQGRQPIGSVRTYVRSEVLDMQAIAEGYRAGRTFATSGPLIDLRVAEAGPGEEVRFPERGAPIQVHVEAVSIGRLDRVEILVNGQVYQTFKSTQPHRIIGACQVSSERSSWIAARVYGPEDCHLASKLEGRPLGAGQFAHTTPIYVRVEGKPIFAAQPADAEYFVRWCDAVSAGLAQPEAVVTERLARARKIFVDLSNCVR